jgi:hypothetical protein
MQQCAERAITALSDPKTNICNYPQSTPVATPPVVLLLAQQQTSVPTEHHNHSNYKSTQHTFGLFFLSAATISARAAFHL